MSFNVKKIGSYGFRLLYALCLENAALQAMEEISTTKKTNVIGQLNLNNLGHFNINIKTNVYIQAAKNTLSVIESMITNFDVNTEEKIKLMISASLCQIENSKISNTDSVNKIIKDFDDNVMLIGSDHIQFSLDPLKKFQNFVALGLKAKNFEELDQVNDKVEQFSEEDIYCLLNKNLPIGKKTLKQSRQVVWNSLYKNVDEITDKNTIILSNLICDSAFDPSILDKNFTYKRIYGFLENICKSNEKTTNKEKALYYSARFVFEKTDNLDLNLTKDEQNKLVWKKLDKAKNISGCNYVKTFMAHLIVNNKFIPEDCDNLNQAYQKASALLAETEKKQTEIKKPFLKGQKNPKSKMLLTLKIKSRYDKKSLLDICLENIRKDTEKRKQDDLLTADKTDLSSDSSDGNRKKRKVEVAPRKIYHHLSENDKKKILALDKDDILNQREIAEEIGCSSAAVGAFLRKSD